jgi:DNA-binding beta-propeller fold protein YncE
LLVVLAVPASGVPPIEVLPDSSACVSEVPNATCVDGVGLDGAFGIAVSPEGENVYLASVVSGAVAVFARDQSTGRLTQLAGMDACVSDNGSGGACADGRALSNAFRLAVSPDGENVYVASQIGIAVFDRNLVGGALTQKAGTAGCINESGSDGCAF